MEVIERLKSPVVIVQLITILGTIVVLLLPDTAPFVKEVVSVVSVVINVLAGLNNPTSPTKF